ncbi:MAG: GTP 3',8-cyclase MoaA [bacterium]|nr:GTP 3',8-cyclase MoaA [bacterium]
MLKDNFGREINYLRISLTDRCNLRCIYCLPTEGVALLPHDDIMTYEEILRFVRIIAGLGVDKVRLTGGEPLVRSGIIDFIKELKKIPGLKDLSLTTNGIIFQDKLEELYKAGLRRVNISVNTLKKDKYLKITGAKNNHFTKIIRGIEEALEIGMDPIKINVVALKGINDDEILDFARLSKDKNLHIRFIEFMPIKERGIDWHGSFIPVETIKLIIENKYGKLIPFKKKYGGPADSFKLKDSKGTLGFISPISSCFCEDCNRLRLTSDGKLRLCLFSDTEVDVKNMIRNGANEKDLINMIKQAVSEKPKQHNLNIKNNSFLGCRRTMAEIGG